MRRGPAPGCAASGAAALAVAAALNASLLLAGCGAAATGTDASRRLDAFFGDLHARGLFDGAVVVGQGRRIVWQKGFGFANIERQIPFTPDTAADGASLAKTFTATLLVLLQHDGILSLDDPAQRYLKELPYPEITLRHLLTHSSGLAGSDYGYFDAFLPPDRVRTTETLLAVLAAQKPPLAFPPGTGFEYSSFGYDLAALAAERAAGASYAQLLEARIFRPLGIVSAFVRPALLSDFPAGRTLAYKRAGDRIGLNDVFDREGFHGGCNIYISARDLQRWNASFFDNSLLDDEELAQLMAPARIGHAASGLTLGSWYSASDGSAFWYSGHLQGFHSEVFRNELSHRSIVYMSNNTLDPWLQKGLVRAVNDILSGSAPRVAPPGTEAIADEARASLAGRWQTSDGEAMTIESRGDRLELVRQDVRYHLFPEGGAKAFYAPGCDLMVGFQKGADGTLSRIYVSSNLAARWGTR